MAWRRSALIPQRMTAMPDRITDFYLVEVPTPRHAELLAARISRQYLNAGVRQDGVLRPVIWTGSPLAERGVLFLSIGAVRAAEGSGLSLAPLRPVAAHELPAHRTLLMGMPLDRRQGQGGRQAQDGGA
jgi:hypothetical protein